MSKNIVVISGAAGFLGSHMAEKMLKEGYGVIALDNYITGKHENIGRLKKSYGNRLTIKPYDITKSHEYLIDALAGSPFFNSVREIKYVLNFASPASPIAYLRNPIETMQVCSYGTENLLQLSYDAQATFLQTSTSEVYGDPLVNPQPETYFGNVNPIGPRSVYDEGKRYAEALVMAYHNYYKVDTRIVRIFNTYGPYMASHDGRVVPNFINQALNNEDITINGDGKQTRSFCYYTDLIEGIYLLLKSGYNNPVNIGNPFEITMNELCGEIVHLILDTKSRVIYKDMPQDDPKVRCPDITLAKNILGWEPVVSLEEGLRKTVEYFKRIKNEKL